MTTSLDLVRQLFSKVAQVIVQSRVQVAPEEFREQRPNEWFNLQLPEVKSVWKLLRTWCVQPAGSAEVRIPPLVLDVLLEKDSAVSERQLYLLERWTFSLEETSRGRRGAEQLELATVYKHANILIRSLYTFLRQIPAQRLCRLQRKSKLSLSQIRLTCQISQAPSPARAFHGVDVDAYAFTPVTTPYGSLGLAVTYRADVYELSTVQQSIPSEIIISEYEPAADKHSPASRPMQVARPSAAAGAAIASSLAVGSGGSSSFAPHSMPEAPAPLFPELPPVRVQERGLMSQQQQRRLRRDSEDEATTAAATEKQRQQQTDEDGGTPPIDIPGGVARRGGGGGGDAQGPWTGGLSVSPPAPMANLVSPPLLPPFRPSSVSTNAAEPLAVMSSTPPFHSPPMPYAARSSLTSMSNTGAMAAAVQDDHDVGGGTGGSSSEVGVFSSSFTDRRRESWTGQGLHRAPWKSAHASDVSSPPAGSGNAGRSSLVAGSSLPDASVAAAAQATAPRRASRLPFAAAGTGVDEDAEIGSFVLDCQTAPALPSLGTRRASSSALAPAVPSWTDGQASVLQLTDDLDRLQHSVAGIDAVLSPPRASGGSSSTSLQFAGDGDLGDSDAAPPLTSLAPEHASWRRSARPASAETSTRAGLRGGDSDGGDGGGGGGDGGDDGSVTAALPTVLQPGAGYVQRQVMQRVPPGPPPPRPQPTLSAVTESSEDDDDNGNDDVARVEDLLAMQDSLFAGGPPLL